MVKTIPYGTYTIPTKQQGKFPAALFLYFSVASNTATHICGGGEQTFRNMHERRWEENLWDFANLVNYGREMDLKAQPEWQHSAYIYDGELVSQDALGNINYGYFGTYCNIPNSILVIAGGVAQLLFSDAGEYYVFFDDKRDTYRIQQGIDLYRQTH